MVAPVPEVAGGRGRRRRRGRVEGQRGLAGRPRGENGGGLGRRHSTGEMSLLSLLLVQCCSPLSMSRAAPERKLRKSCPRPLLATSSLALARGVGEGGPTDRIRHTAKAAAAFACLLSSPLFAASRVWRDVREVFVQIYLKTPMSITITVQLLDRQTWKMKMISCCAVMGIFIVLLLVRTVQNGVLLLNSLSTSQHQVTEAPPEACFLTVCDTSSKLTFQARIC